MKKGRIFTAILVLALMASIIGTVAVATASSGSHACSQNIAMVPDARGLHPCCGTCELPTSGFPGFLADGVTPFTPSFTNLSPVNIRDDASCPIEAGGYDTVVLNCIEDNTSDFMGSVTFRDRIHAFIFNGGKLIIYTSEQENSPGWVDFIRPFVSDVPGAMGSIGTPCGITEENTLSSSDPTSFYYIDMQAMTDQTDAVGDANVFVSYDGRWCEDMWAENYNEEVGPAHAYSHYGEGLIIYNGLDIDYADDPYAGQTAGINALEKIWMLELMQPWNPSGLPCSQPIGNLLLDCGSTTNYVDTEHCVTATLTDDDDLPVNGADITFTVTGVNPTGPTDVKTDINGEAEFCYTGTNTGKDIIIASCDDPEGSGITLYSNECEKEWIPGEEPPPPMEVGGDVYPTNRISLLAPWLGLAAIAVAIAGVTLVLKRRRI